MFDLAGYKIFFIILQVLLPYFLVLRMILLVNILWIYDSLYVTFFFSPPWSLEFKFVYLVCSGTYMMMWLT